MARTTILGSDVQAIERWSSEVWMEFIAETFFGKFMGRPKTSIIRVMSELTKGPGDTIRYDFLNKLSGYGLQGAAVIKNNEQALVYSQDSLGIDQLREAVNWDRMSQQRTVHDFLEEAVGELGKFFARVFDEYMFAQLAGTAGSDTAGTALNAAMGSFAGNSFAAPDTNHVITTGAANTLDNIRKLKERALSVTPLMKPARMGGEDLYALCLHPASMTAIKNESGSNKWREIAARAYERGKANPVFTGASGEFDGVMLYESPYVRSDTANVRHNVFLGQGAGVVGFGQDYRTLGSAPTRRNTGAFPFFSLHDDVDDYGDKIGVAGAAIWGLKKCRFTIGGTATDYGVIRLTTTDAAA